jgi:hypothetical protein
LAAGKWRPSTSGLCYGQRIGLDGPQVEAVDAVPSRNVLLQFPNAALSALGYQRATSTKELIGMIHKILHD